MIDVLIIGGGASGLASAVAAKKENPHARICILEQKDMIGKKILSTGNGRCNFTNEKMGPEFFYSDHPENVDRVIKKFGTEDTLSFFRGLGIVPKEKNGYYYPRSEQATAILNVFKLFIKSSEIEVHTGTRVESIRKTKKGFLIETSEGKLEGRCIILALGGKASKVLGSDGSGYDLAKSFGHSMIPVVPALVQLRTKKHPLLKASGVRAEATVSIFSDEKFLAKDTGELQITAYGISGIPVFQVSRHAAKALYYKKDVAAELDFFPSMSEEELFDFYKKRRKEHNAYCAADFLVGIFNQKLIPCLLRGAKIREDVKVSELTDENLLMLSRTCKHTKLIVEDTNGFDNAQVCAGGICLKEINPDTMESLFCEGLYLTGELLDVDGICGGYNLQWAWASGVLAGIAAGKRINRRQV